MSERATRTLRIERTFDAPAERVFEAWTSEEVLRRWFHVYPEWDTPTAEVDLQVGGEVRVVMRDPSDGAEYGAREKQISVTSRWLRWTREPSSPSARLVQPGHAPSV